MTNQEKQKVVNVAGFCGGGVFFLVNLVTGKVPGGFLAGVAGYLIFGGLAALVVYVIMPKVNSNHSKVTEAKQAE